MRETHTVTAVIILAVAMVVFTVVVSGRGALRSGVTKTTRLGTIPSEHMPPQKPTIRIGATDGATTPPGAAEALASVMAVKSDGAQVTVSARATVEDLVDALAHGEDALAVCPADAQYRAWTGTGPWTDTGPRTALRSVTTFMIDPVIRIERANLRDDAEAAVSIDMCAESTLRRDRVMALFDAGVFGEDASPANERSRDAALDALRSGESDACVFAVRNTAALLDTVAKGRSDLIVAPVTLDATVLESAPWFAPTTITLVADDGAYTSVRTTGVPVSVLASATTDDTAVRLAVEGAIETRKTLGDRVDSLPKTAEMGTLGCFAPLHAAAKRAYENRDLPHAAVADEDGDGATESGE